MSKEKSYLEIGKQYACGIAKPKARYKSATDIFLFQGEMQRGLG